MIDLAGVQPRRTRAAPFWNSAYAPRDELIHVDLDETAFGRAYPDVPTLGLRCDVSLFLRELLSRGGSAPRKAVPLPEVVLDASPRDERGPRGGRVHPQAVMAAVQRNVVDATEAFVFTEAGNSFAWTTHHLRFDHPNRYCVSTGFRAMGHATTGVIGASIATRRSRSPLSATARCS